MASTEDRVRKLIADNLEVDGKPVDASMDLSSNLTDAGVSSMDIVSFARVIQDAFGIRFTPDQCTELQSIGQLIEYLDANAA